MSVSGLRFLPALLGAALLIAAVPVAVAQGAGEQKPQEQGQKPPGAPPADAAKEEKKKVIDEFAEAARMLPGPAGNPECLWLGRRIVSLLGDSDIDTALRHLEFYDRFGCPGEHVQQVFRCVVRQGDPVVRQGDPDAKDVKKNVERRDARIFGCWLNPSLPPVVATPAIGTPPGTSSQ